MNALYILYDDTCGFCCRCAVWLRQQPSLVPLAVLPAGAPETKAHFPLEAAKKSELVVIDGDGGVYRDTDAWLMTLWALRDFREWSLRLARGNRELARKVVELAGTWRHGLTRLFRLTSEAELRRELEQLPESPRCEGTQCELPKCRSCGQQTQAGHSFCAKCLVEALET